MKKGYFRITEKQIEEKIERILAHPGFLFLISSFLNASATIKIFQRKLLEKVWNQLELPNKEQQERVLFLLSQMEYRIRKIENNVDSVQHNQHSMSSNKYVRTKQTVSDAHTI